MSDDGTGSRPTDGRDAKRPPKRTPERTQRQQRQAEALRRNLLRRKAQVRRRGDGDPEPEGGKGSDDRG